MAMSVVYSNFCGMVVSETRGGVESDYLHDSLGSTIGLMNSAGSLTDRWEYWPWGEVASRTGTNATPLTFLGVIGYFKDVLDKLFYVRARHLRLDLARWLTVDPFWQRLPAYAYAANSPTWAVDPSGLDYCDDRNADCVSNADKAFDAGMKVIDTVSVILGILVGICFFAFKTNIPALTVCLITIAIAFASVLVAIGILLSVHHNALDHCEECMCACKNTLRTFESKQYMMKCTQWDWTEQTDETCPGWRF